MPNLNEIAEFRKELKNIAHEEQVISKWGDRVYDELPPPEQKVPDIDLDSLLPNDSPAQSASKTQQTPSAVRSPLETVPPEKEDSSITDNTDNEELFTTSSDDLGDFDNFLSSMDFDSALEEADKPPISNEGSDESPVFNAEEALSTGIPENDEAQEKTADDTTADFDDFLSSFDFDESDADNADFSETDDIPFDSFTPDIPEDTSSDTENDSTDLEPLDEDGSSPDDTALDSPLDFDDTLSPFNIEDEQEATDKTTSDELDNIAIPDFSEDEEHAIFEDTDNESGGLDTFDFSGFENLSNDMSSNEPDRQEETEVTTEPEPSSFDDMQELSLFSEPQYDEPESESENKIAEESSSEEVFPFSGNDFNFLDNAEPDGSDTTGIREDKSITEDFDSISQPSSAFEPTEVAIESIPDFDNAFIPPPPPDDDNPDFNGFSLEENVLENDIAEVSDDQFNLPDNFKDFSADSHAHHFNSVIAKSTSASAGDASLNITDDEYFDFLHRLESFPLNVQLAIQDYIGNGDDTDQNKMDFVRFILSKASLRKVAKRLEKILNKSIPIPKGFQRKSVEEYEREKKTFKYRFMHKFLPVAVMTGIALLFIFCLSVLSWQFIYKPVTSESLYKTGYSYLQNEQYETAIEKFDKAGEYKRKKKWYFAYARAFRQKKQFTAAEKMYIRLLYDFNNDKQGGLEYADMLSTDLRNYEKAEVVLRRRLLDNHVNDKEGLLALGDVYMNWGDEDPEKYASAVKIYSRLIELYGASDTFLVRMMRYFIRIDNLAEVLPLKEHFLPRLSKISAVDITELGGYLLEKRYNPKPLDSEKLRNRIDDLRTLLEKAVQTDRTIPEAYYNLGRFFIYNYKPDAAIENLIEAINRFKTASPMTARRMIHYIDSMRLLGEQFIGQKKYLDAQTLYADALNMYREYTSFKPLPPNKIIGKLYANSGDIDYFISYNFDAALDSYQNAIQELYDTPSINYRIGYIHYQQENYQKAIEAMSIAYADKPKDKNVLYGFGNALFKRGDYFAAQASYQQLMDAMEIQRNRKGRLFPNTRPDDAAFIEQYMHTANNLGATLNRLSERTGDSQKNARALALYAEATRAWDALTRNPTTMIRSKSVGLAYLNTQNMVNQRNGYSSEIYTDIPMVLENENMLTQKEDK